MIEIPRAALVVNEVRIKVLFMMHRIFWDGKMVQSRKYVEVLRVPNVVINYDFQVSRS
jgi:hypothetical protein